MLRPLSSHKRCDDVFLCFDRQLLTVLVPGAVWDPLEVSFCP